MLPHDVTMTRIEPASPRDAATLARLSARVHGLHVRHAPRVFIEPVEADRRAEFEALLARDNARVFIAYAGEAAIGYLAALIQERPATPLARARRWLYIDQVSVEPRWERRGVARQLVRQAIDLGRDLGIDEFVADVWCFNAGARAFFEACGFRPQMLRLSTQVDG